MSINFGQIGDLRGMSLSINGKITCDSQRNIYARNLHAKDVLINGQSITQVGGVINAPILTNVPGISRLSVQNGPKLYGDAPTQIIYANTWGLDFESTVSGVSLVQQNNHLFQVPLSLPSLPNISSMVVESVAQFTTVCAGFVDLDYIYGDYFEIDLLKNGEIVSSTFVDPGNAFVRVNQTSLHDITICNAGDTLDYQISQYSEEGSVVVISGNSSSWVTFKVLDFQFAT